ncbi:uncharacterized protein LOC110427625 [Herrania umbratica]|uniref:Uncharacterized protein LOC110427625 n=1 Tax=Herrania umbratica TaxID=108875 RepID=A0A6J1BHS2_9ROSI|nr:uncharacterized protein LOC110427625 [Herrania umbratica]
MFFSLFEAWLAIKPIVTHLRVFDCVCDAKIPDAKRSKLDEKSMIAVHLDYNGVLKGYKLLYVKTRKLINTSIVEAVLNKDVIANVMSDTEEDMALDKNVNEVPVRETPSLQDVYHRCHVAITEPSCCLEATSNEHYKQAMKAKMIMIKKNNTMTLVDGPKN